MTKRTGRRMGRLPALSSAGGPLGGSSIVMHGADIEPRPFEADPLHDLFDSHYLVMLRTATALLGNRQNAEDVVQEAFAEIDKALARIDQSARPAYLRAAVINRCHSNIRRDRTIKRQPIATRDETPTVEDHAVRGDVRGRVLMALDSLPSRQRQCLTLRYYEGLTDTEVAETVGISLGTAKTHLRRGLDALHTTLGDLR